MSTLNGMEPAPTKGPDEAISERLEALRASLRAQDISQGELIELQNLVPYIEPGDVELLEAAGVPEFPDETAEQS
jgi:hypothetical protein